MSQPANWTVWRFVIYTTSNLQAAFSPYQYISCKTVTGTALWPVLNHSLCLGSVLSTPETFSGPYNCCHYIVAGTVFTKKRSTEVQLIPDLPVAIPSNFNASCKHQGSYGIPSLYLSWKMSSSILCTKLNHSVNKSATYWRITNAISTVGTFFSLTALTMTVSALAHLRMC